MSEKKTLNEDLFYKGSSANLPRLHTCENKIPFWDFKEFAVTVCMCMYVCIYMYVYMWGVYLCTYICLCVHICIQVCISILVCVCVFIYMLMHSILLLQQHPTCLVHLISMVFEIVSGHTLLFFLGGGASRICSKQHIAILCSSHVTFSLHILLASIWFIHTVLMIQSQL